MSMETSPDNYGCCPLERWAGVEGRWLNKGWAHSTQHLPITSTSVPALLPFLMELWQGRVSKHELHLRVAFFHSKRKGTNTALSIQSLKKVYRMILNKFKYDRKILCSKLLEKLFQINVLSHVSDIHRLQMIQITQTGNEIIQCSAIGIWG